MNSDSRQFPLIVIEGLEGASKSTSIATCIPVLEQYGPATIVREPGGTPIAEKLRSICKEHHDETLSGLSELMLMMASRIQLFDNVISPHLQSSAVLSDRNWLSSFAYQYAGRQCVTLEEFSALYQLVMAKRRPYDFVIYLDIPPEVGMLRARQRGELDRIEREHLDFFHRARAGYHQIIKALPQSVTINADRSTEHVQADVKAAISDFMSRWTAPSAQHPNFSLCQI